MNDLPLRVLIVDDSEDDALLLVRALKKGGYDPVYERVETPAAMKKAVNDNPWDIILCDYKLPTFSGSSAISFLMESGMDIPLIIVSGAINETVAVECMRLGAKDYVLKSNFSRLCPAIARELQEAEVRKKQKQTEEQLRQEEQRFRAYVEHSSDIIVILNPEGTIKYINPAVEKVLGYTPEERIGRKGFELIHPDDLNFLGKAFNTLISDANPRVISGEIHLHHKDGNWLTLEAVGSSLIRDHVVEAVIVNYRDITGRKKAEERLLAEEQRFKALAEQSSDIILLINNKGVITYENPAVERIMGFKIQDRIGAHAFDNVHPQDMHRVDGAFKAFVDEKEAPPRQSEVRIRDLEGNWHTFESVARHLISGNDEDEIIINLRDITERKKSEDALRESEEKYRELIQHAPVGIYEVDYETGRLKSANDILCQYSGYIRDELLNMKFYDLFTEESQKYLAYRFEKLCAGESIPATAEYCIITKTGERLWISLKARYIYEGNKLIGAAGIVHNITERKLAEDALRESEQRYLGLSILDDLTRLYNSRHFYDQLKKETERSRRYEQPLTLMMLDLDRFKEFNDAYGHIEGDNVLSRFGQVIKECLRETDSAYRYGGEEFTIILPMTTSEEAIATANRIQAELRKEIFYPMPDQAVRITASIGLSQYRQNEEMKVFVHRVDQIMYRAKHDGRDMICRG